jgi:DNA-binding NtrC family response regulator
MDTGSGTFGRETPYSANAATHDSGDNPRQAAEKSAGRRILVVDDEALIRWSVSETLTSLGMVVEEAVDGASAVRCLAERAPFEVVVLDFRLPDNDDLTLLTRVRSMCPRSAVVLMTAFGTPEVRDAALQLGASAIIGKPFELGEMAHLVETLADLSPN